MRVRRGADYLFMVAGGVVLIAGLFCVFMPEISYHTARKPPVIPGMVQGEGHGSFTVPLAYAIAAVLLGAWCLVRTFRISRRST